MDQDASLNKNVSISRVGYRFAGWSLTPDGAATIGDGDRVAYIGTLQEDGSYSVKLYAVWVPYKYGINYNMNVPENALKVKNGSKEYSVGVITDQNLNKDMNPIYEMGKQYNLPANTYSIVGWNFVGWSLKPDGSGTIYGDCAPFKDLATCDGANETVTLYAIWEVDPYTVGENVSSGSIVCDTNGKRSFKVYVNEVPRNCTGTTVIYLKDNPGNIITDLSDEVYIVGNPSITYGSTGNNYLCFFNISEGFSRILHLKNFNFVSGTSHGVVNNYLGSSEKFGDCVGGNITIEVIGNCSIKSTAGNIAIALEKQNVTFTGSGTLEIYGGDGANATVAGGNGADGAVGIVANNIIVNMVDDKGQTGTLKVYGGKGGNGQAGKKGDDGSNGSKTSWGDGENGDSGKNGSDGGAGGNGALPIRSNTHV